MRTWFILLIMAGQTLANSYSTNFPAGEMGNWLQGKTNGLDWSNVVNVPGLAFGTQPGASQYDDSTAVVAGSWGNDQSAQGVVSVPAVPRSVGEVEIRLRTKISPHSITGYEFNASISPGGGAYMQIVRWNGALASFTYLASSGVIARSGDTLTATAVGSRLTWYKNGQVVCAANDSSFPSGSPGIGMYSNDGSNENGYGFANFSATDNGSSAPSPTPSATPLPQAYATWESSLLSEMQAAGISQSRINTVQAWLANNPPKP